MDNTGLMKEFSKRLGVFSINLYQQILLAKPNENVVFSPFSIQTCAAMARIGAEGTTAKEMDNGLGLISSDAATTAEMFHHVLATYENSDILKIANKIYVMQGHSVQDQYNEILSKKFLSTAEEIDFGQKESAAKTINNWVESKTNNLIKDLVTADAMGSDKRLVLLNAIHFKGEWQHKFRKHDTRNDDFYLNESDTVKVPMMSLKERFRYAELSELDATAIEMPYRNSNLSMLVILPNSRTGLKNLESKLKNIDLADISANMYTTQVIVKFPRFKADFSIELTEPFKQLGMSRMFTGEAEFGKMMKGSEPLQVSKIIHKAFIDVNEEGTEAAAATGMMMCLGSMPMFQPMPKHFYADRPFYYRIQNKEGTTLFAGKLVNIL